jgi:hypothetical protein
MVASLPCLEGSFGGFLLRTSLDDCAGEAEGLGVAFEAFRRPAFDGRGVTLGVAFDALLFFLGPSFGGFFS